MLKQANAVAESFGYFFNEKGEVVYKVPLDTVINRIKLRGREFEVDDSLMEYYKFLWEGYDYWVNNCYSASDVVIIDMDKLDIVNSEEDKKELIRLVEEKLKNRQ